MGDVDLKTDGVSVVRYKQLTYLLRLETKITFSN